MYNKILVPLDGSPLAECTLEHVKSVTSGSPVPEVVLFRVVEPILSNEASAWAQAGYSAVEVDNRRKEEVKKYLSQVAEKLIAQGINARGEVEFGRPADTILDYAEKNQFDVIVMSTHGRSGISRWAFGSVAEKISRHSNIPVLIVTPSGCRDKE
jgi:nucleotide-binding universal stress UspA family protein